MFTTFKAEKYKDYVITNTGFAFIYVNSDTYEQQAKALAEQMKSEGIDKGRIYIHEIVDDEGNEGDVLDFFDI